LLVACLPACLPACLGLKSGAVLTLSLYADMYWAMILDIELRTAPCSVCDTSSEGIVEERAASWMDWKCARKQLEKRTGQ
jgi:hypothetical protein